MRAARTGSALPVRVGARECVPCAAASGSATGVNEMATRLRRRESGCEVSGVRTDREGSPAERHGGRGPVVVDLATGVVGSMAAVATVVALAVTDIGSLRWPLLLLFIILALAAGARATRGTPKPFRFSVTVALLTAAFVGASWQPWGGPWALIPVAAVFASAEARHRWGSPGDRTEPPDRPPRRTGPHHRHGPSE